ncbi:MAG TPA: acyl-CoA thioesterase domain-containing protein, partial [Lapillicoccus sp.]
MDSPEGMASLGPLEELLSVLDLTHLGEAHVRVDGVEGDEESDLGESSADVFVAESQKMPHGRVFGGQVLAQALMAAGRTVEPDRRVHSLHSYFLRPGDPKAPIV